MKWVALLAGIGLGLLLFAFKVLESALYARNLSLDLYIGLVALLFLCTGVYIGRKVYLRSGAKPKPQPVTSLSRREQEVLDLMAAGLSNREIAQKLTVSINTVKTHITNIYDKLEVRRRTKAIARARELGLIMI